MDFDRRVTELDVNDILPNRFQPRIKFNEESINELCDSIREHGVIQPIVVRKMGDKYEIIAGERRFKASLLAGKNSIPAVITELNDKDSAEIALIENVQRKDLTPIEEAISYKKILDMGYLTQEDLAIKLGKTQSTVANKLRLLNLSEEVQEALLEEKISERHARSLLRLQNHNQQIDMLNKIVMDRLTVRKADDEIAKILKMDIDKEKNSLEKNIMPFMDNNNVNFMATPNMEVELPKISEEPINPFLNNEKINEYQEETKENSNFSQTSIENKFNNNSSYLNEDISSFEPKIELDNEFQNNYVDPVYEHDFNNDVVPSFEGNQNTFIPNLKLDHEINEDLKFDEPVIIIEEENDMNNNQFNNFQNYNQSYNNTPNNQSNEFNPFDMANNSVNNDFNIPLTPIEESPQMGNPFQQTNNDFISVGQPQNNNLGIEEPQINVPTIDNSINPGFMDIDKIKSEAVDINTLNNDFAMPDQNAQNIGSDFGIQPIENNYTQSSNMAHDFGLFTSEDNLLRPTTPPVNSVIEEHTDLQPGKFFHLPIEEEEDKNEEVRLDTNPFEFNVNGDPSNLTLNMTDQPKLKSLDEVSQFTEQTLPMENSFIQPMMNQQQSTNFNDNPVNQFGFNQIEKQNQQNNDFNFGSGIQVQTTQTQIPPMQQQPQTNFGMMQQQNIQQPKDINAAMSAIKECVFKIKSLGFNVNTEDFDFENMYQIMFRIEK